jgi:hypothetical protein
MAVELRNALGTLVGRPQPATLLFNYPTTAELIEYLSGELAGDAGPAAAAAAVTPAETQPAEQSLDGLSEDDLEALLARKLSSGVGDRH